MTDKSRVRIRRNEFKCVNGVVLFVGYFVDSSTITTSEDSEFGEVGERERCGGGCDGVSGGGVRRRER